MSRRTKVKMYRVQYYSRAHRARAPTESWTLPSLIPYRLCARFWRHIANPLPGCGPRLRCRPAGSRSRCRPAALVSDAMVLLRARPVRKARLVRRLLIVVEPGKPACELVYDGLSVRMVVDEVAQSFSQPAEGNLLVAPPVGQFLDAPVGEIQRLALRSEHGVHDRRLLGGMGLGRAGRGS